MHLPSAISAEIYEHFTSHWEANPTDYAIVYGSSVYSPDKITSDVDLFVVTHAGKIALNPLVRFINELHLRHGRRVDEEVPYDNKVHYTKDEVETAVQFGGFDIRGLRITVPPVRKDSSFLRSPQIKARLALNALTTPHAVMGKDLSLYSTTRLRAGEAATLLAINLVNKVEFNPTDLHKALTVSSTNQSGEMFLGYKTEYPTVDEYLYEVLDEGLDRLAKNEVINTSQGGYVVEWDKFNPVEYMRATR